MVKQGLKARATWLLRKIKTKLQKKLVKFVAKVSQNRKNAMKQDSCNLSVHAKIQLKLFSNLKEKYSKRQKLLLY